MKNNEILPKNRAALLADVAEMYFIQEKTQAEIAKAIGVTRSNVSRMLMEAKKTGIVHIEIKRPLRENPALAQKLMDRFHLLKARVLIIEQYSELLSTLGKAAGDELASHLKPNFIVGTSWGTAVSTAVDETEISITIPGIKVVQLLGALGSRNEQYDAHAIVQRLASNLDAEAIFMNAPFLVENADIARSLISNKSVQEALKFGNQANIALLGVGSSEIEHSSYYQANYVHKNEILEIQSSGAIGDVCGRFYDLNGNMTAQKFQERLIGISVEYLKRIPIRIGVAGGLAKVQPIIGALRGGLINILISDERTILEVLKQNN
jgi:DNA-binding transcriptional regulator LsrR (DeoR family)